MMVDRRAMRGGSFVLLVILTRRRWDANGYGFTKTCAELFIFREIVLFANRLAVFSMRNDYLCAQ